MLSEDDPTVRAAVFGKQIEHFLQSDIGSYMLHCATNQRSAALDRLARVDAAKADDIRAIQLELKVAEKFIDWLGDAVAAGLQATQHIQEDA